MKLTVVTDQDGQIVGTARQRRAGDPAGGTGGLVAGPGQVVHEVDEDDLEEVDDLDEFYGRVRSHLPPR